MKEKLKNFINGEWITSTNNDCIEIRNPAFDEIIAYHPKSNKSEVDQAVNSANLAFNSWRHTPPMKRASLMFEFRNKLIERKSKIAKIMVNEHGKTMADALGELTRAIECIEYVCGTPELQKGIYAENVGTGVDAYYILEPLGPFAILPPFNFPALISCYLAWPIAMGNTVVIKPPDYCPMTVQCITEAFDDSGFPKGILNLICGSAETGNSLVTHPDIVGVTFVGSSKVGRIVYQNATNNGKRAQIQGGAKNHIVISADCSLEANLNGIVSAAFGSTSQRCFAASNLLVHESIYEQFLKLFLEESKKIRMGYGMDENVDIGPLVSRQSLENAKSYFDRALKSGAKIILDGINPKVEKYPKGYFMSPTILEADETMEIWREEVFAPIRCVKPFKNLKDALSIINSSEYGHSAAIFTESGGIGREFVRLCNTGHVGINVGTPVPLSYMSVGGRKASFFGDLRGQGNDAVSFCTDKKFVAQRWTTPLI